MSTIGTNKLVGAISLVRIVDADQETEVGVSHFSGNAELPDLTDSNGQRLTIWHGEHSILILMHWLMTDIASDKGE